MKRLLFIALCLAGFGVSAQAQTIIIPQQQYDGVVIVAGAAPVMTPVVYNQPVVYNAPVQYNAPVIYNAPVVSTYPSAEGAAGCAAEYACADQSSVQVIHFGSHQAAREGYYFNSPR